MKLGRVLRSLPMAVAGVAVWLLLTGWAATDAFAHERLKRSAPADGARVSMPREIRLTFTEPPELAFTRIQLLDSAGREVALSPIRLVSDTAGQVVADIAGNILPGLYTVAWQVASRDGHPVRGRFTFTVLEPAQTSPGESTPSPVDPSRQPDHTAAMTDRQDSGFTAESPSYIVIRSLNYLALLGIIGTVAFRVLVLGAMKKAKGLVRIRFITEAERRAAGLGVATAVLLLVMAAVRLYAQSYAVHGGENATNLPLIAAMVRQTTWGWGWILQVGAAALLLIAFVSARRGRRWGWALASVAAIAAAVSPAFSGHAASAPRVPGLTVLSDTVHVLGAGTWLGALLVLVAAGLPASRSESDDERHAAVASLVNTYSPVALTSAGITALSGLFAAWMHVGTIPNLWSTPYGVTLLLKTLVLSGVAGIGAYNWRFVRPRLGDAGGTTRITRSARLELGIALVVIIITAVLVAQPVPTQQNIVGAIGR